MEVAMRAHVLENNIVVNTIEVDDLDFLPNLIDGEVGGIGWIYDGISLRNPNAPSQEELIEVQWAVIRAERNARLTASDWTQLADAPVDAAEWAAYRQELRDLPANTTDPFNPAWPDMPA
jgi:hypothetical protein